MFLDVFLQSVLLAIRGTLTYTYSERMPNRLGPGSSGSGSTEYMI